MIFVNRENEIKVLERALDSVIRGEKQILLIHGLRRVGKTRLITEFLSGKNGFLINCMEFTHGAEFFKAIYSQLARLLGIPYPFEPGDIKEPILKRFYPFYKKPLDDSLEMIRNAFDLISEISSLFKYLIIALDEFHGFIENASRQSMPPPYELSREKLLWTIRGKLQSAPHNIFWILSTSAGFLVEEYGRADRAFLELFKKLEIKPLDVRSTREMARSFLTKYGIRFSEDTLVKVSEMSGGIPALVEKICFHLSDLDDISELDVVERVKNALLDGEFDEFFYSYINFIVESSKWSRQTLIRILRSIAEGLKRVKEISEQTKIKPQTVANILTDLRKKGVLTRDNNIVYPLLREWLLARDMPPRGLPRVDLLLYNLGVTLETYVREVFSKLRYKVEIKGSDEMFYGTADSIEIGPIRYVRGGGVIDLIAEEEKGKIVMEIKSGVVSNRDVLNLVKKVNELGIEPKFVFLLALEGALPSAIAEAGRRNVILLSKSALKELARKAGMPYIY